MDPATRYTLWRNSASIMKVCFAQVGLCFVSGVTDSTYCTESTVGGAVGRRRRNLPFTPALPTLLSGFTGLSSPELSLMRGGSYQ